MEISQGVKYIDTLTGEEKYKQQTTPPKIVVRMTNTQFAEAITTMGMWVGTPCTITHIDGNRVEYCPEQENTLSKVIEENRVLVKEVTDRAIGRLDALVALAVKKAGVKDAAEIKSLADTIKRNLASDISFHQQQIVEVGERVVGSAKGEIAGAITGAIHQAGLKHIAANTLLGGPDKENNI